MTEKPKNKKQKYQFTVAVLGDVNTYHRYIETSMTHDHELPDGTTISVAPENLYRLKMGLGGRLRWKLWGISSGFLVVFGSDSKKAVSYEPPKYSAKVLKTINESQALKTALREEFKQAMSSKTLFMYFLLIAGAVVVYLVLTGQLSV